MKPGIHLSLVRVSTQLWLAQLVRGDTIRTATAETRGAALRLLMEAQESTRHLLAWQQARGLEERAWSGRVITATERAAVDYSRDLRAENERLREALIHLRDSAQLRATPSLQGIADDALSETGGAS